MEKSMRNVILAGIVALIIVGGLIIVYMGRIDPKGMVSGEDKGSNSTGPDNSLPVLVYDGFEEDLEEILARDDNTIQRVDLTRKKEAIENIKSFANYLGVETDDLNPDNKGRLIKKTMAGELVDSYMIYVPDRDPNVLRDELLVSRKSWSSSKGVNKDFALSNDEVVEIAQQALRQYGIPDTDQDDSTHTAAVTQLRNITGEEDEDAWVVRQTAGFYRKAGDRQVINSLVQVDVDPESSEIVGVSLKNWWGLEEPEEVELKTLPRLKRDIIKTVQDNGSKEYQIKITSCQPTYYQQSNVMVPSITCTALHILGDEVNVSKSAIAVNVAIATPFPLDERIIATILEEEEEADPLPHDYGDASGSRFGLYYTTDETRFLYGIQGFRDMFKYVWTDYDGSRWAYKNFFVGSLAHDYADNADLIYVVSHAGMKGFSGQDSYVYLNHATSDVAQLGTADLEYMVHAGCDIASAVYCEGMKATTRFTDTDSRDTAFTGLHILSSNHGSGISNKSVHYNKGFTYALYLMLGLTFIEAWDEAELDTNYWTDDYEEGCGRISSPDSNCTLDNPGYDCDRYWSYPATMYIKGKRNVTVNNRSSYTSDPRKGDSDYDVDLYYRYQSETVPIYSSGYSLPGT